MAPRRKGHVQIESYGSEGAEEGHGEKGGEEDERLCVVYYIKQRNTRL